MTLSQPILSVACLLPVLYGVMTTRTTDARRAPKLALFGAVCTLVAVAGIALMFYSGGDSSTGTSALLEHSLTLIGSRVHYQMGVDALTVPLLLLVAGAVVAIMLAGPQDELTPDALSALLITEGFTLGMFAARDLVIFSICWVAALVPANLWARRHLAADNRARRMLLMMSLGSSAPLLMAVAWLGTVDRVHSGVFDLLELHTHGIDPHFQTPIFVLVVAAALVRMGVVPFHSWLPAIWKGAPIPVVAMTVTAPAGVYLLARFGLPLLPHDATGRVPFIADLALITSLYGALLALGQRDLKRMLGALAISQSGMMLIGLASTNAQGETGALLLCIGDRAALCGLFLMVWMVRVRTGTTDMNQLGGLVNTMPRLAGGFLVFALAAMGAPGTLGFVAEDLLVSGIIEAYPWITVVVVITTALNGITLVRAFSRIFLGPSQDPRVERRLLADLSLSQRWVAAAVVLFLVGSGVFPGPLTASIRRAARQMDVEVVGD